MKAFSLIKNSEMRLIIISNFQIDWAISPTKEEKLLTKKIIAKDPRISIISNISHKEVITWMRKSHLYVSTTFADPFNNTILEAMACGLPIITSDVSSIPEFVSHKKNGMIITITPELKERIVEDIFNNIITIYENQNMRENMSKKSTEIIYKKFTIEKRNNDLKEVYDDALI